MLADSTGITYNIYTHTPGKHGDVVAAVDCPSRRRQPADGGASRPVNYQGCSGLRMGQATPKSIQRDA